MGLYCEVRDEVTHPLYKDGSLVCEECDNLYKDRYIHYGMGIEETEDEADDEEEAPLPRLPNPNPNPNPNCRSVPRQGSSEEKKDEDFKRIWARLDQLEQLEQKDAVRATKGNKRRRITGAGGSRKKGARQQVDKNARKRVCFGGEQALEELAKEAPKEVPEEVLEGRKRCKRCAGILPDGVRCSECPWDT